MYLQIAVGSVIVVGVVVAAWGPISDYRHRQGAANIDEALQTRAQQVIDDELRARVDRLKIDRCGNVAFKAIQENATKRITVPAAMTAGLLSDLRLCVERGIMSPYIRDQLSEADILKFAVIP